MNDRPIPLLPAPLPDDVLRRVLDKLPAATYLCDAEGLITYWNERAVQLWGREPRLRDRRDRFCGSFRLFGTDGAPIPHEQCWMALALRENRECLGKEIVIERPDGTRRRALAHANPLHDTAGRLIGAINVLVDITSPALLEQRLNRLLDSIDDHFVQYDRDWRYTFVTDKGAAMVGRSREELLGRSIWELFPEAVGNLYYQKLHEAAATGHTVRFEHYYAPFDRWYDNHIYSTGDGITVFTTDITQRKAAEVALREAEERHAALLDLVPVGVYRCDADGVVRYYNGRAAELWGRAPDLGRDEVRFCGSLRLFTVTGEPVLHERCPMADALRTGVAVHNHEVVIERPDGSRLTALVNIEPLRDDAGRITGAVNVLQDISERRQAEEMRSRLAAIVESSQDAIIGKDLAGRVISWNAAAERLYGYRTAEMLGESVTRLYPEHRAGEEDRLLERIRAGERIEHFETIRLRKDGTPVEISMTVSPVRDGNGRIVGASSASRDISQRKAHERALRASEARYRSLAEASGAIVFVSDAAAHWHVPQPAWEAYTGQCFAEYRGQGWAAAVHPDDRERVRASIDEALRTGTPWHAEGRIWHAPSGSYRYQEARAVPIRDADGQLCEWVGTCVDVHARTIAEQAVRDADRRKDEFLAVLAHELRNPLAPIVSSLQILRMPDAGAAHASVLDVLDRQVHHLVRLVDDLMEVSRITRGAIELRREPVLLDEAVRAAVEISRPLIDAQGHRLEVREAGAPIQVDGDRVRLTQIVANLLNNAAKYTPRGGLIRVRMQSRDGQAVISVIDNGIGIAPEAQQRIFEMFQRGGSFASGLGIGLGLSRRLAELHGGMVEVFSAGPGHGSEFTLRLPAAAATASPTLCAGPADGSGQRRRVLVVDDNEDAATCLATLLRTLGHDVRTALDGSTALEAACEFRPDIALVDLGMPTPDGFAVAQHIRNKPWGAAMRLVAVSGWGQAADRRRSSACGFDLHLVKPLGLDDVRTLLGPQGAGAAAGGGAT